MFCPEGYIHWGDFLGMTEYWAETVIAAENLVQLGEDPTKASDDRGRASVLHKAFPEILGVDGMVGNFDEAQFVYELFHTWIIANFIQNHLPVMCSPTGTILKTNWWISRHADQLDWCHWSWPPQKNLSFLRYFDNYRRGNFNGKDIDARFPCLDPSTGVIVTKNNSESLLGLALNADENSESVHRIFEQCIKPFAGWSLCWKAEELPKTLEQVFDELGIISESWRSILGDTPSSTKSGFASKGMAYTLSCVLDAFPDGKGNATWAEVENRVGYSRRSILRAIKASPTHSNWAAIGQNQV